MDGFFGAEAGSVQPWWPPDPVQIGVATPFSFFDCGTVLTGFKSGRPRPRPTSLYTPAYIL